MPFRIGQSKPGYSKFSFPVETPGHGPVRGQIKYPMAQGSHRNATRLQIGLFPVRMFILFCSCDEPGLATCVAHVLRSGNFAWTGELSTFAPDVWLTSGSAAHSTTPGNNHPRDIHESYSQHWRLVSNSGRDTAIGIKHSTGSGHSTVIGWS